MLKYHLPGFKRFSLRYYKLQYVVSVQSIPYCLYCSVRNTRRRPHTCSSSFISTRVHTHYRYNIEVFRYYCWYRFFLFLSRSKYAIVIVELRYYYNNYLHFVHCFYFMHLVHFLVKLSQFLFGTSNSVILVEITSGIPMHFENVRVIGPRMFSIVYIYILYSYYWSWEPVFYGLFVSPLATDTHFSVSKVPAMHCIVI